MPRAKHAVRALCIQSWQTVAGGSSGRAAVAGQYKRRRKQGAGLLTDAASDRSRERWAVRHRLLATHIEHLHNSEQTGTGVRRACMLQAWDTPRRM